MGQERTMDGNGNIKSNFNKATVFDMVLGIDLE